MSWSREQVNLLISEYKKHNCLYNVKSLNYKNKHARNAALTEIVSSLSSVRKEVTIPEVKSKFAAIRQNFLIEHRKHLKSLKYGIAPKQIYVPSIWYYNSLSFILEHAMPKIDEIGENTCFRNQNITVKEEEPVAEVDNYDSQLDLAYDEISIDDAPSTSTSTSYGETTVRTANNRRTDEEYFQDASTALSQIATALTTQRESNSVPKSVDRIDVFLKFVESKLRRIQDDDILDEAEYSILEVIHKNYSKYKKM